MGAAWVPVVRCRKSRSERGEVGFMFALVVYYRDVGCIVEESLVMGWGNAGSIASARVELSDEELDGCARAEKQEKWWVFNRVEAGLLGPSDSRP